MDYLSNAVNQETAAYLYTTVKPRLGLKDEDVIEVSDDAQWLTVVEEPEKPKVSPIILPNGMKVTPEKLN